MTTIEEIMKYRSFEKATFITGAGGLRNEVSGVMVMEAMDIESWGRKGLMILTSYFAMEDVSTEELDLFFLRAKEIKISAMVVKIDRLVNKVPDIFIHYCRHYDIPLFQIDKATSYEKIISEILETIINRNAYVLQTFYDIHKQFTKLMMVQPDIPVILETLKALIDKPVSLWEKTEQRIIGTDTFFNDYKVIQVQPRLYDQKVNYTFEQNIVTYGTDDSQTFKQLVVEIPNLGYEEFFLVIHEGQQDSSDVDLMAIENAITAIQIELLNRYAIRQNNRSRLNEMGSDLLHGRLTKQEDIDDTTLQLGLNPKHSYRIILVNFETKKAFEQDNETLLNRFSDIITNYSRLIFPQRVYITRKNKVIIIAPSEHSNLSETKQKIREAMDALKETDLYPHFNVYTTISNDVSIDQLAEGYRQAFDTQKLLQLTTSSEPIASYQDMGIYQLFVETDNLNNLQRFIPENIMRLKQENPELLKTLQTFIDLNQNFTDTAQKLFIHPKTVRYRIERLKKSYHFNLDQPEEILRYSIGFRLLNLIRGEDSEENL